MYTGNAMKRTDCTGKGRTNDPRNVRKNQNKGSWEASRNSRGPHQETHKAAQQGTNCDHCETGKQTHEGTNGSARRSWGEPNGNPTGIHGGTRWFGLDLKLEVRLGLRTYSRT